MEIALSIKLVMEKFELGIDLQPYNFLMKEKLNEFFVEYQLIKFHEILLIVTLNLPSPIGHLVFV